MNTDKKDWQRLAKTRKRDVLRHISNYIDSEQGLTQQADGEKTACPKRIWEAVCLDAADISGADLVSFWLYDTSRQEIKCCAVHDADNPDAKENMVLSANDYPRYFKIINEESGIIANSVLTDSSMAELVDPYLKEAGVLSLMDYVVRGPDNQPAAIICCENRKEKMKWDKSHISGLRSLATLVQFHFKETPWLTGVTSA